MAKKVSLWKAMRSGVKSVINREPIYRYEGKGKKRIGTLVTYYDPNKTENSKIFSIPEWK